MQFQCYEVVIKHKIIEMSSFLVLIENLPCVLSIEKGNEEVKLTLETRGCPKVIMGTSIITSATSSDIIF